MPGFCKGFGFLLWIFQPYLFAADETLSQWSPLADTGAEILLKKSQIKEGTLFAVRIKGNIPSTEHLSGRFGESSFLFFEDGVGQWMALVPVAYETKPGPKKLEIDIGKKKGTVEVTVVDGAYPIEKLKVDPKHVNPPKSVQKRIATELKEVGEIYSRVTQQRLWKSFDFPISSPVTSPFGGRRVYNGETRSFHGGLDLKALVGTPIHAPAKGRVALAKFLYFSGGTVLIDHGYGLITMYAHMSKISVKPGDVVESGQSLGLSGKTGRVTGPHLHWQVVLNHQKVNPMGLIEDLKP